MVAPRLARVRDLDGWQIVEIFVGVAHLVGIVQRRCHHALVPGLEHDDALAFCQNDPRQCDHVLVAHRLADNRECFLPDLIIGNGRIWKDFQVRPPATSQAGKTERRRGQRHEPPAIEAGDGIAREIG